MDAPLSDGYRADAQARQINIITAINQLKRLSLDAIQTAQENADPVELAVTYVTLREAKEGIEGAYKQLAQVLEILGTRDFPELLDKSQLKNVPLKELGRRVGTSTRVKCSMVADRKEDAMGWLKGQKDFRGLVVEYVHPASLSATAKDLGKEGKELPGDLFSTWIQDITTWASI